MHGYVTKIISTLVLVCFLIHSTEMLTIGQGSGTKDAKTAGSDVCQTESCCCSGSGCCVSCDMQNSSRRSDGSEERAPETRSAAYSVALSSCNPISLSVQLSIHKQLAVPTVGDERIAYPDIVEFPHMRTLSHISKYLSSIFHPPQS